MNSKFIDVRTFEELAEIKSKTHTLRIEENTSAFILEDEKVKYYLSTHTFYGGSHTKYCQKILRECGFNVTLIDKGYT